MEKNSQNGTPTDANGRYSIQISGSTSVLVFSSIGYLPLEKTVGNVSQLNVVLVADEKSLDEVIVVGYGTQNKKDISGAVANINAEKLSTLPVTGVDQLMQGQAAGVQISQSNAAPDGAVKVSIRGSVSITSGSQPLYVVDGYPITNIDNQMANPLSNINPNDIASIEILKDASASAIYGSRASNGVVLITTKKGQAGKVQFSLDAYTGFQSVQRKVDVLNAREFATLYVESRNNGYLDFYGDKGAKVTDSNQQRAALGAGSGALYLIDPSLADPSKFGEGTDWQNEIFRTAPISNAQLSARGGTEKVRYYLSGGYFDQQGIVIESGLKRYSFNANMDANVTEKVRLGFNLNTSYSKNKIVNAEGSYHEGGVVTSALMMPPTMAVRDENGNYQSLLDVYPTWGFIDTSNPVQTARETQRNANQFRSIGSFFGEYSILNNLKFKGLFGADYYNYEENKFSPSTVRPNTRGGNTAYRTTNSFLNYLAEFTLNYAKSFGKHTFSALGGYTIQKQSYLGTNVQSTDFPNDYVTDVSGGVISGYSSDPSEWSLLSYIGRVNYDYQSKYLLTVNFRRDGSSRFGANTKWGNFPSVSAGWRISEENFMPKSSVVNELKIRASYGLTGNNAIGNYASIGLLRQRSYVVNGNVVLGQVKSSLQNDDLSWESTRQFDVGFELGMLNNRIFIVADYYSKLTNDLLLNLPVSAISGVSSVTSNVGEVSNKGLEFSLTSKNLVGSFSWSTNLNVSGNRNKVKKLGLSDNPIFFGAIAGLSHVAAVGSPIGSYYGLQWDGLYLTEEELRNGSRSTIGGRAAYVGDVRWKDINDDGVIDDGDRSIIGDWQPKFVYGMTNTFSYKNFDLSVFIQGSEGNQVYNIQKRNLGVRVIYGNEYTESLTRWQSVESPGNGVLPKIKRAVASNSTTTSSDYYVDDASYLSIKNITLGYTLPNKLANAISLSKLRAYVSVQNAFLFTKYLNYNPEVNASNTTSAYNTGINPLTPGIDYGSYPLARTVSMGLNVTF